MEIHYFTATEEYSVSTYICTYSSKEQNVGLLYIPSKPSEESAKVLSTSNDCVTWEAPELLSKNTGNRNATPHFHTESSASGRDWHPPAHWKMRQAISQSDGDHQCGRLFLSSVSLNSDPNAVLERRSFSKRQKVV